MDLVPRMVPKEMPDGTLVLAPVYVPRKSDAAMGVEVKFDFKNFEQLVVVSTNDIGNLPKIGDPHPWMGFDPGELRIEDESFDELTGIWTVTFAFVDDDPQPIIVEAK